MTPDQQQLVLEYVADLAEAVTGRRPGEVTSFPSAPVDADTAALLDMISGDPLHDGDRAAVITAILSVGRANGGVIDPNQVRERIPESVYHRVIGATYRTLAQRGVIVPDGWVISADKRGRNSGKPARRYRLQAMGGAE